MTSTPSTSTQVKTDNNSSLIPPIVLGCIFGIFIIILIFSLYCFCVRKKRCQLARGSTPHTQTINDTTAKTSTYMERTDSGCNVNARLSLHVNEPINSYFDKSKHETDDMFTFMEQNEKDKLICAYKQKCVTLDRRRKEKENLSKDVLYKSLSSPSVLGAPEMDHAPIDTTTLLKDCNVSELEDIVAELDSSRIPKLERSMFKDSYDPFCHSESADVSFKDISSLHIPTIEKPLELYTLEKTLESHPLENPLASYRKDSSNSKDADISSSGTVESKTFGITNIKEEPHRDSKSSDSKSSGYSEGNTSSDNCENLSPITRFISLPSRNDIGYHSDASSQLSPFDFMNSKYPRSKYATIGHNVQFFSEDEAIVHSSPRRPMMPPSYTQAVVDIERMSEKSEKTDSEKSFDYLLEMEKQLGVRIADSEDNDLTTKSLMQCRYRHSVPRNYFSDTGYMSDIQSGHWRDKYTNREKTLRCNQLLEEFKSTKKSDDVTVDEPSRSPTNIHFNVIDNVIPEEEVRKRRNSSGSTFNEWLV